MRQSDVVKGGLYEGPGVYRLREVDFVFEVGGEMRVHWYTIATMAAVWSDGRAFHTPNRTCSLRHFARWARGRVDEPKEGSE